MKEQCGSQDGSKEPELFEEAAALLLRLHVPDSGLTELEDFESWRRRSPEHRAVAGEVEQLWSDIGRVRNLPWPTEAELASDREYDRESRGGKRLVPGQSWLTRPLVAGGAIAASVLVVLATIFTYLSSAATFETGIGEHRLIHLADGSEVMLGGKSRVRVSFNENQRLVFMDIGEGLFTVAEDAERPFNVDTGDVNIRAVGTAFNIRNGPQRVVVSVVEGSVRVSGLNSLGDETLPLVSDGAVSSGTAPLAVNRELATGEQVVIGKNDDFAKVEVTDMGNAIAWRDGRFVFSGEPLASVVAELNRYSVSQIEIADEELAELMFSGTVLRGHIDDWLEGLEQAFPVRLDRADQTRVIIRASNRPTPGR